MTETAQRATLILPACSTFEKSGTSTDLAGDLLPVFGSVVAPGEARADGDMLVDIAQALGVAIPEPGALEGAVRLAAAAPSAWGPPDVVTLGAAAAEAGGLRLIVEAAIFSGGGTSAFDERAAGLRPGPRAAFHPQTAAALHIADGDRVDLAASSGRGELLGLTAVLSPRIPPGAVAVVDGISGAPANAFEPGAGVRMTPARIAAGAGA
jgi:anaerobic selenocysteine-containing dehydrogenase